MSRRHKPSVVESPLAVGSDGSVLLNVAASHGPGDPKALLERALAEGRPIFIGIGVTPAEMTLVMKWADDSTAELAAWLWGARHRRRREQARRTKRTPS